MDALTIQIIWLLLLALPVSCIAWTVTHEEVFKEVHEYCVRRSKDCKGLVSRKFFYLFTCEFCFSHYVTILFIALTGFKLLMADWRGYVIAFFAVVWVANVYMSLYALIRIDLKKERLNATIKEKHLEEEE